MEPSDPSVQNLLASTLLVNMACRGNEKKINGNQIPFNVLLSSMDKIKIQDVSVFQTYAVSGKAKSHTSNTRPRRYASMCMMVNNCPVRPYVLLTRQTSD